MSIIRSKRIKYELFQDKEFDVYEDINFVQILREMGIIESDDIIYHTDKPNDFINAFQNFNCSMLPREDLYINYLKKFKDLKTLNEKHCIRGENFWIEMYPNEMSGHNRPHVHVKYSDKSVAVISIDNNIEVIQSAKGKKDYSDAVNLIRINLNELRHLWNNNTVSSFKFKSDNVTYYC